MDKLGECVNEMIQDAIEEDNLDDCKTYLDQFGGYMDDLREYIDQISPDASPEVQDQLFTDIDGVLLIMEGLASKLRPVFATFVEPSAS